MYSRCSFAKRKYLSPIYLHTSLGRSAGANPLVEYRSLTGQMGYSKSFNSYSGILVLGAFLQQTDLSAPDNRWYYVMLLNSYSKTTLIYLLSFSSFTLNHYEYDSITSSIIWPQATHISEDDNNNAPPANSLGIVMPPYV